VYTKNTPFGNLSVTRTAGQLNYFENGNLLFSTENQIFQEEAVHFALLQHSRPETILIVSGGITGMANESFKYRSVERVDYLEINRWLAHAEMKLSSYAPDPRLRIIQEDARKWIKNITAAYDVIIINAPDPSNAQINRFFTVEFFKEVKQALALGGIFSISLSPTVNYMSSEAKLINRIVYHSLKSVFQHVVVIPGEKNYFIASDGDVHLDIVRAIQSADIQNEYLQQGYIDDDLLKQNSRLIMNEISTGQARINRDLSPIAYFLQIRYWLTLFKGMDGTLVFLVMIMFALVLFSMPWKKTSAVTFGIFAGGFAGAASEFLILIIFQILYGHLYQILGILISFYMTGLASGALFGVSKGRRNAVRSFMLVQMFLFALVMLIPPLTVLISQHHNMPIWAGQTVLFGLTGGIAFMAGLEFNMASRLEKQSVASAAGNLYGVDLAGAAFGTLLVSMICLPLLGLLLSCVLIGVLILAGVLSMFVSRSKYGIS
jgi:spermidine synthase